MIPKALEGACVCEAYGFALDLNRPTLDKRMQELEDKAILKVVFSGISWIPGLHLRVKISVYILVIFSNPKIRALGKSRMSK